MCQFCNQVLAQTIHIKKEYDCCNNTDIESIHGRQICMTCGIIHGDIFLPEFVDIYENLFRIRKKSIYHRKYHIENVLFAIRQKYDIDLSYKQRDKIYKLFNEIENILPSLNKHRKRMISIKFIIKQILRMLDIQCENIHITSSKKTMRYYISYWDQIMDLIGDRIQAILKR